jgi:tagatose-6-phosphate ketose/aldose isomerase
VFGLDDSALEGRGAAHTAREIAQQPALWRQVADDPQRLDAAAYANRRIVLTGAGSSAFAGEIVAPALTRHLGRGVEAIATTDIVADPRAAFAGDVPTLLVSFARSGDSPESVAATRLADQLLADCAHLVVTCNAEGKLNRTHGDAPGSQVILLPDEANDRGFAMTSSLTSMVLATLLAFGVPVDVDRAATAAEQQLHAEPPALVPEGTERVVYLGSGPLHGLAKEAALKLLELSAGRIVAYADSSLGFRHGPKAILDERTRAFVLISSDPYTSRYDEDIAAELGEHAERWSLELDDPAAALVHAVAAQRLALKASLDLGLTPDDPFPGGAVNRVVQGVTIHDL